jgi:ABC-type nitrate/sulfonate/bicarbonate transport system permease component
MSGRGVARRLLTAFTLPVILLAIWWILTAGSTSFFWPPLSTILRTFPRPGSAPGSRPDVLPSLARLAVGYSARRRARVAAGGPDRPVPVPARSDGTDAGVLPRLPPPVLVPVIALFAGYTGSLSKVMTITLGCIWPVLLNTVEGSGPWTRSCSTPPAATT